MDEIRREIARELAHKYLAAGDASGWFEALYAQADRDSSIIPWADMKPNPNLITWLDCAHFHGNGQKALKVGCGLGDDAEELALRGFNTTAFDISQTAISWCRSRYLNTSVTYIAADLFEAPLEWQRAFDFVVESYTLQVLPPDLRIKAIHRIADFVAPGGVLLVIARGRELPEPEGKMPWPLTRNELNTFSNAGLIESSFEDYMDGENPPVRRFRALYRRKG